MLGDKSVVDEVKQLLAELALKALADDLSPIRRPVSAHVPDYSPSSARRHRSRGPELLLTWWSTLHVLSRPEWLAASELRIGLGCMRMSTDESRDEALALETIAAAADAGMTVFDTARAYGRGIAELGHNERLLPVVSAVRARTGACGS